MTTIIYDVLLEQQHYRPVSGYYGEPKYTCIFYGEVKKKALKEIQKYVDKNGVYVPSKDTTNQPDTSDGSIIYTGKV